MSGTRHLFTLVAFLVLGHSNAFAASGVIEQQLADIGTVTNDEVVVVQRQFTRKNMRHEFTPITLGGMPFGTVRRTLLGSASYTLHLNDNWGLELFNFAYTKTLFSSFTDDINNNKDPSVNAGQDDIRPDFQKLLWFATMGVVWTPTYGKVATFSQFIAYIEPYIGLGFGVAKTEADLYFAFYPAVGIRVFFKEWFSMKLEFRDYLYTEKFQTRTNPPTEATSLKNNYAVMVSLSFWLPKMP